MKTIKNQIKEILVNDLKIQGVQASDISDTEPLFEDGLGLDSLDAVELVVLIQKHFDVKIADMDEGKKAFASVEALAAYIKEHQAD